MAGLYCEDFTVGQKFKHALTRTVTEMDNTLLSLLTLQALNQNDEVVGRCRRTALMHKRPA